MRSRIVSFCSSLYTRSIHVRIYSTDRTCVAYPKAKFELTRERQRIWRIEKFLMFLVDLLIYTSILLAVLLCCETCFDQVKSSIVHATTSRLAWVQKCNLNSHKSGRCMAVLVQKVWCSLRESNNKGQPIGQEERKGRKGGQKKEDTRREKRNSGLSLQVCLEKRKWM